MVVECFLHPREPMRHAGYRGCGALRTTESHRRLRQAHLGGSELRETGPCFSLPPMTNTRSENRTRGLSVGLCGPAFRELCLSERRTLWWYVGAAPYINVIQSKRYNLTECRFTVCFFLSMCPLLISLTAQLFLAMHLSQYHVPR